MESLAPGRRLLLVADPAEKLNPRSDTSLSLAEAALAAGWKVYLSDSRHIEVVGTEICVEQAVEVLSTDTSHLRLGARTGLLELAHFEMALIRKDPPFDEEYKDLCWLLAAQKRTKTVNAAELLLAFHEKSLQLRACAEGHLHPTELVPSCISRHIPRLMDFARGETVLKPWLGHGGEGVEVCADSDALYARLKLLQRDGDILATPVIVQPFLPEIRTHGDRRVLMAGSRVLGDFVRYPAPGKIVSNLAQGGLPALEALSPEQSDVLARLGTFLAQQGIAFAGVDLIGTRISEVNITSPTGVRTLQQLSGRNIAPELFCSFLGEVP